MPRPPPRMARIWAMMLRMSPGAAARGRQPFFSRIRKAFRALRELGDCFACPGAARAAVVTALPQKSPPWAIHMRSIALFTRQGFAHRGPSQRGPVLRHSPRWSARRTERSNDGKSCMSGSRSRCRLISCRMSANVMGFRPSRIVATNARCSQPGPRDMGLSVHCEHLRRYPRRLW
jgi:hypothetical protein